jgi:hypothetical protein
MNLIRTAKGTFTINEASCGWGVLDLHSGKVHECRSEQECWDWLKSHGPPEPGQSFPKVFNVFPSDEQKEETNDAD